MTPDKAQRVAVGVAVGLAAVTYIRKATKGEAITPKPLLASAAVAGTCALIAEWNPDVAALLAVLVLAGALFNPAAEFAGTVRTIQDNKAHARVNSTGGIPRAAPQDPTIPGYNNPLRNLPGWVG